MYCAAFCAEHRYRLITGRKYQRVGGGEDVGVGVGGVADVAWAG